MNGILINLTYYAGYYTIKYTNIVSSYLIKKSFDLIFNYFNNKMIKDYPEDYEEDYEEDYNCITNQNDYTEIYNKKYNTEIELIKLKKRIEDLETNIKKYKDDNMENN